MASDLPQDEITDRVVDDFLAKNTRKTIVSEKSPLHNDYRMSILDTSPLDIHAYPSATHYIYTESMYNDFSRYMVESQEIPSMVRNNAGNMLVGKKTDTGEKRLSQRFKHIIQKWLPLAVRSKMEMEIYKKKFKKLTGPFYYLGFDKLHGNSEDSFLGIKHTEPLDFRDIVEDVTGIKMSYRHDNILGHLYDTIHRELKIDSISDSYFYYSEDDKRIEPIFRKYAFYNRLQILFRENKLPIVPFLAPSDIPDLTKAWEVTEKPEYRNFGNSVRYMREVKQKVEKEYNEDKLPKELNDYIKNNNMFWLQNLYAKNLWLQNLTNKYLIDEAGITAEKVSVRQYNELRLLIYQDAQMNHLDKDIDMYRNKIPHISYKPDEFKFREDEYMKDIITGPIIFPYHKKHQPSHDYDYLDNNYNTLEKDGRVLRIAGNTFPSVSHFIYMKSIEQFIIDKDPYQEIVYRGGDPDSLSSYRTLSEIINIINKNEARYLKKYQQMLINKAIGFKYSQSEEFKNYLYNSTGNYEYHAAANEIHKDYISRTLTKWYLELMKIGWKPERVLFSVYDKDVNDVVYQYLREKTIDICETIAQFAKYIYSFDYMNVERVEPGNNIVNLEPKQVQIIQDDIQTTQEYEPPEDEVRISTNVISFQMILAVLRGIYGMNLAVNKLINYPSEKFIDDVIATISSIYPEISFAENPNRKGVYKDNVGKEDVAYLIWIYLCHLLNKSYDKDKEVFVTKIKNAREILVRINQPENIDSLFKSFFHILYNLNTYTKRKELSSKEIEVVFRIILTNKGYDALMLNQPVTERDLNKYKITLQSICVFDEKHFNEISIMISRIIDNIQLLSKSLKNKVFRRINFFTLIAKLPKTDQNGKYFFDDDRDRVLKVYMNRVNQLLEQMIKNYDLPSSSTFELLDGTENPDEAFAVLFPGTVPPKDRTFYLPLKRIVDTIGLIKELSSLAIVQ